MSDTSIALRFILNLNSVQLAAAKRFDAKLGVHSIGLTDFTILFHLAEAPDEKLRRTDLAEKVGLTASGITRVLLPLEKLGMVRREANSRDARVSYVKLAPAGKRILKEAITTAETIAEGVVAPLKSRRIDDLLKAMQELGGMV